MSKHFQLQNIISDCSHSLNNLSVSLMHHLLRMFSEVKWCVGALFHSYNGEILFRQLPRSRYEDKTILQHDCFVQSKSNQWNCKTLEPPGGQTLLPPSEGNSNQLHVCHSLNLTLPYLHIIVTAISNFLHVPCLFITHCSWTFQRMGPTAVKAWKIEFMSAHFNGQSSNAEVVGVTFEIC